MSTLPKGIVLVQWKNKDNTTTSKYKVRITRKDFQCNKNFDDLEEAKEFLALSKAKRGKELIYSITDKEQKEREQQKEQEEKEKLKKQETTKYSRYDQEFGYYVEQYISEYVNNRPQDTELQRRNIGNIKSFYKTILTTKINISKYSDHEVEGFKKSNPEYYESCFREFGKISIEYIKPRAINLYIRARTTKVKPVSIAREITHISNVFRKLHHLDPTLPDFENPALKYDTDLLKNRTSKKELDISNSELKRFFTLLQERENPAMYNICMLSYLTAMRRSEVIYLTKSAIKENYILLKTTKSNRARRVYLDEDSKPFAHSLKTLEDSDRFFYYTTTGFDRVFKAFVTRHKFDIRFHDFRRLAISRTLLRFGSDNTVLITELLGIVSIPKFEELHIEHQQEPTNQRNALMSFGHRTPQTTKGYFNIPKAEEKNK